MRIRVGSLCKVLVDYSYSQVSMKSKPKGIIIVMRHVKHRACHIQEDIWACLSILSLLQLCP